MIRESCIRALARHGSTLCWQRLDGELFIWDGAAWPALQVAGERCYLHGLLRCPMEIQSHGPASFLGCSFPGSGARLTNDGTTSGSLRR